MDLAVICVDDEKSVLAGIEQQLLKEFGHEKFILELAQSADEALDIIEGLSKSNIEIPIVITDQMMPGLKGSELINILKERSPNTKCIMLTGYTNDDIKEITNQNLIKIVNKPWNYKELTSLVGEAIS